MHRAPSMSVHVDIFTTVDETVGSRFRIRIQAIHWRTRLKFMAQTWYVEMGRGAVGWEGYP